MHFCDRATASRMFEGKHVALVGSGPGVLDNAPGAIDAHEVVVRVNNFKLSERAGFRTDVHASFYGGSIRKTVAELKASGVKLCLCKCPNAKFMDSWWHTQHGKLKGVDFSYIYESRANWWFTETFVPTVEEFMVGFNLLGRHIPTSGFAALLDVLSFQPASLLISGMDFFASKVHNVNEKWRPGDPTDPIGHVPERERQWLAENIDKHPIRLDPVLTKIMGDIECSIGLQK